MYLSSAEELLLQFDLTGSGGKVLRIKYNLPVDA